MLSMLFANYPQPKLTFVIEPGGYLQWQEINFSAISIATAKAGLEQSNMNELLSEVQNVGFGKYVIRPQQQLTGRERPPASCVTRERACRVE